MVGPPLISFEFIESMKRSTLVALAILVLLIGIVYWLERDDGSVADVERVFDVAEDAIERVTILRLAGEPVVLEREDESFRIVRPLDAACDQREVNLVLSNLATMTLVRSFAREDDTDMTEFGLETPTLEVRFVTIDGGEYGLRFGKDTLTPSNQYAERIGSDEVLVVASHVSNNLNKSAWDVRDKAIFHLPENAEPELVSIVRGEETIELVKDGGVWKTVNPPRARVDRFAITGMVARFRRAEMLDLAEDADSQGFDPPKYRLDVAFSGDTDDIGHLALEIGSKKNIDYFARVPSRDQVFVIEGGLADELQKDVRDLWSKKLLHHGTTETTVVRIVSPDEERFLARDEAQGLLSALANTTAEEFVTTLPPGDPAFVITVSTDDAEDEFSIRLDGRRRLRDEKRRGHHAETAKRSLERNRDRTAIRSSLTSRARLPRSARLRNLRWRRVVRRAGLTRTYRGFVHSHIVGRLGIYFFLVAFGGTEPSPEKDASPGLACTEYLRYFLTNSLASFSVRGYGTSDTV